VIAIGRNPPKPEPFTLNVGGRQALFLPCVSRTMTRLLLELLDREKPQSSSITQRRARVAVSWKHSWRFFETNSMALARLVSTDDPPVSRALHSDRTSELYGSVELPAKEDSPIQPTSPYAASKAAFDMHLIAIHKVLKFPMNIIRPSNAYCPGQLLPPRDPKAVICGLTGKRLPLQGGGRAEKSYIHARDLAAPSIWWRKRRRLYCV